MTTRAIELMSAANAKARLDALLHERAAARHSGLGHNAMYMSDLQAEIAACQTAYVGAEVTERALRRSAAQGRLRG